MLFTSHAGIINSLPHGDRVPQLANNYMTQLKDILVWLCKHCSWSVQYTKVCNGCHFTVRAEHAEACAKGV